MQLTSTLQLITFWIFVAAMSGSIVGAPRSCAWRSLSSCCLNQNITEQLIFINQMSWHLRGGFSHLVFPGQIKIWSVDFLRKVKNSRSQWKTLGSKDKKQQQTLSTCLQCDARIGNWTLTSGKQSYRGGFGGEQCYTVQIHDCRD